MNWAMPILVPGNPQEVLDLGLAGLAMSRYSGSWVGLKLVTNVCDAGGVVDLDLQRHRLRVPDQYVKKSETRMLSLRGRSPPSTKPSGPRLEAAKRFAAHNRLNRIEGATHAKLGIATAGKAYYDLLQALKDAGLEDQLEPAGIRIAKFGMTFPLTKPPFARDFASGLETILVIEEKRAFLETQLRDALYSLPERPVIIGKQDAQGQTLVPNYNELDPDLIATILERVLTAGGLAERVRALVRPAPDTLPPVRLPNFCSGCPHNRSTLLLPGQAAGGGTGCHGNGHPHAGYRPRL